MAWAAQIEFAGGAQAISQGLIGGSSFRGHARENRHIIIDIVVDHHLALGVVETMKASGILSDSAFPRDWHGQEQRVETGVIKTFSEISANCDDNAFVGFGNPASCSRSSALSRTTYFLTAIFFPDTNHLHRCFKATVIQNLPSKSTTGVTRRHDAPAA